MPAPQHVRVIHSGVFGTAADPVEQWSFSFALQLVGLTSRSMLASLAQNFEGNAATSLPSLLTSECRLTRIRCALIGSNGKTARDDSGAYVLGDRICDIPGSGASKIPLQNSLAVTLETGRSGNVGRGRFYLPCPQAAASVTLGAITSTAASSLGTAIGGWLDSLETDAATFENSPGVKVFGRVAVASGGSAGQAIPPAVLPVTGVTIGRVVDTQRRRRADLEEMRVLTPLVA